MKRVSFLLSVTLLISTNYATAQYYNQKITCEKVTTNLHSTYFKVSTSIAGGYFVSKYLNFYFNIINRNNEYVIGSYLTENKILDLLSCICVGLVTAKYLYKLQSALDRVLDTLGKKSEPKTV
ncbi:MAG: hypothetical protein Q8Q25_03365 [bacterium]|nr:hypothetical protein [bacterium]